MIDNRFNGFIRNTADFGHDYRFGPRETKIETYTWKFPETIAVGDVSVNVEMDYRKLPVAVAKLLQVPEEETRAVFINDAMTQVIIRD